MKPIYPCLWFDQNAKQAADCYVKAFTSSRIVGDSEIVVMADLAGQKFMLLNGGPRG
jgi:predicted 3-demethylubiquinone-9 3-methyltransferase (glyoxalase superfamily)